MFDHILLPVDDTDESHHALTLAVRIADAYGATVHALSVVERRFGSSGPLRDLLDRQADAVGSATRAAAARMRVEDDRRDPCRPAPEILHAADEHGVDLLALGTHGRTGIDRLAMGSVAAAVAHDADRPVLTVPATGDGRPRAQE